VEESKKKQLCGEFVADSGIYEKFVFGDKNSVTITAMGIEFPLTYFVSENTVYVKTDKAFLELEIETDALLRGKDTVTKGNGYTRGQAPDKACLPPTREDLERLICFANGTRYQSEGKFKEAARKYLQCCQSGHAGSCNHFGLLKQMLFQDRKIAMDYFRKACDMGYGGGCSNIATIEKRKGNIKRAKELYQEACDKGFKSACVELVLMD
jgi:TPR repeat protein